MNLFCAIATEPALALPVEARFVARGTGITTLASFFDDRHPGLGGIWFSAYRLPVIRRF